MTFGKDHHEREEKRNRSHPNNMNDPNYIRHWLWQHINHWLYVASASDGGI